MKCKYDNTELQAVSESYYWCPKCGVLAYEIPFGDAFGELDYQIPEKKTILEECKHCSFISKTFPSADQMTKREYWLMTEVFVYLHGGKDYCDNKNINYISRDKESKE